MSEGAYKKEMQRCEGMNFAQFLSWADAKLHTHSVEADLVITMRGGEVSPGVPTAGSHSPDTGTESAKVELDKPYTVFLEAKRTQLAGRLHRPRPRPTLQGLLEVVAWVPFPELRRLLRKVVAEQAHEIISAKRGKKIGRAQFQEACTWLLVGGYVLRAPVEALIAYWHGKVGTSK